MSVISELLISEALKEDIEVVTNFIHVLQYKALRILAESDVMISVFLEWSIDGVERCVTEQWKCGSAMWKVETRDVLMPYCRIRVHNQTGAINKKLLVYAFAVDLNTAYSPPAQVAVEPETPKEVVIKDKKVWFRKRSGSGTTSTPPVPQGLCTSMCDFRLPQFVPREALLVGEPNGRIGIIPRGLPGEVLTMGTSGPIWIMPYPPVRDSRSTEKLEAQIYLGEH